MFVSADKMRRPRVIHLDSQYRELRNSHSQCLEYFVQSSVSGLGMCPPDAKQEISPKRIVCNRNWAETLGIPDDLRKEVLIRNRSKELRQDAELLICYRLLQ